MRLGDSVIRNLKDKLPQIRDIRINSSSMRLNTLFLRESKIERDYLFHLPHVHEITNATDDILNIVLYEIR